MVPLQQIRRLSTIVLNKPQLFRKEIQRFSPRADLLPFTWYLGKTLVTSKVSFKNKKNKKEPFECSQCSARFQNSSELEEHIKEFHVVKCQKCPHCDTICTTKYGLNMHLAVCKGTNEEYKCPECQEASITKTGLEYHLKNVHSYDRVYICDFFYGCGRAFKTYLDLSILRTDFSEKSKSLVSQNKHKKVKNETKATKKEKKITTKKRVEEEDEILVLIDPKTKRYKCTFEGCKPVKFLKIKITVH